MIFTRYMKDQSAAACTKTLIHSSAVGLAQHIWQSSSAHVTAIYMCHSPKEARQREGATPFLAAGF